MEAFESWDVSDVFNFCVSYTNRLYSCSKCAAIEVDEWCQGNVSARLSERFHSWNVEITERKRKNFCRRRRVKKKFRANKWSTEWKSHKTSLKNFHKHAVVSEHDSKHDSIQLLNLSFRSQYRAPGIITVL